MANYEYVGTLKNGRHYIVELGKYCEAGEEAPLTEADVTAFGDRFTNVHKAKASELKAFAIGNDEADKIEALQAKLKAAEQIDCYHLPQIHNKLH